MKSKIYLIFQQLFRVCLMLRHLGFQAIPLHGQMSQVKWTLLLKKQQHYIQHKVKPMVDDCAMCC